MSQSDQNKSFTGILDCSDQLGDAYCIRKMTQLLLSGIILIGGIIVLIDIIRKQKVRLNLWLTLLILTMSSCLIINIVFCFFNSQYWLFALETYFYNLYYLLLVGYVAKSYLLKYRQIKNFKKYLLDPQKFMIKNNERRLFFIIFGSITLLYTGILIVSMILQIQQQKHHSQDYHCEQIWYLCFQTACILLSITVLFTLYKNQKEEVGKLAQYKQKMQKKQKGELIIKQDDRVIRKQLGSDVIINNPLKSLWVWITLNVASQLFNIGQSILYVRASPPQCWIVKDSYQVSNIVQLIFVVLSMYLSFASTLFYVAKKAIMCQQNLVDKSPFQSNQNKGDVNIQFGPVEMSKSASNSPD